MTGAVISWGQELAKQLLASMQQKGDSLLRMTITIGDRVPDATLHESTQFGEACPLAPSPVSVAESAAGKRIVVFGLPGAYTLTCSSRHLPGYLRLLDAFHAAGVDELWCVAVNDGYVMAAWGKDQDAIGKIRMLGDGAAEFAKALGIDVDKGKNMGIRMDRFSMLIEDGIVRQFNREVAGKFEVSDAETMLRQLA